MLSQHLNIFKIESIFGDHKNQNTIKYDWGKLNTSEGSYKHLHIFTWVFTLFSHFWGIYFGRNQIILEGFQLNWKGNHVPQEGRKMILEGI